MFCTKINGQIRQALRQFDSYIDTHIDTALSITTQLKNSIASPVADIITAIIPGNLDDMVRGRLLFALDKAIEALAIADTCKLYTDMNDKLKCFIQQIQLREPDLRDALLQKLASLLAAHIDGQRFKQNLYDLYTQVKYTANK